LLFTGLPASFFDAVPALGESFFVSKVNSALYGNKILWDKKKGDSQLTLGSEVPAVLNDSPFYTPNISSPDDSVNAQLVAKSCEHDTSTCLLLCQIYSLAGNKTAIIFLDKCI